MHDHDNVPWRGAAGYDAELHDAAATAGPFSMPWDAPPFLPFPIRFRNVSILTLAYRTDREAIDRVLPPPLGSINDIVLMHIYRMRDVEGMGEVHECNVMVGATLATGDKTVSGGFSVGLYLDSDGGIAHGREVHGQPKKLAALSLQAHGDLVVGTVERNDIRIVTGTMPYKARRADPAAMYCHFDFAENINYKVVPHIDGTPAIRQLTARRLAEVDIDECWSGPCTVELRPNAQAPVWRLPVRESLDGFFWHASFTLVEGRVVHDYLLAG